MWEASEFRDPDLRRKHLDLDATVVVVSTILYLVFLLILDITLNSLKSHHVTFGRITDTKRSSMLSCFY
jgi:hypothetical protein